MYKEVIGANRPNVVKFLILSAFPNLARILRIRLFSDKVSDFFRDVVGRNIEILEGTGSNQDIFFDFLVDLKNNAGYSSKSRKFTLNECLAQAFLFFFAGSDTSSTTISFALTELAFNQDVQNRLRLEILDKTKATNGQISYENLHQMTYLSQVVNETLRKYPPGFSILRTANEDFQVPDSKITIKKGSQVVIPTVGFHYDEQFWANPTKFDPERFSHEEIAKRPQQRYFPFGDGPRNCIGKKFGPMNVKYGVARVIKDLKVTPDKSMNYPIKINPLCQQLAPLGGFLLNFKKIRRC
ncbi:cytochrome P450 6A1-like [Chironomus tepperi]|uniref:cytochrome P450 6A1-like n=1 Tax=Chironomus tepperi TaxID=113505 RepID=UPI00391F3E06